MILYNAFKRLYKLLREIKVFRFLFLLILCFLIPASIISCSNPFSNFSQGKVILNFFVQKGQGDNWVPIVEEFERRNPNIKFVVKNINISHSDKLREEYLKSCLKAPADYDLVAIDIVWLADLVKKGCLSSIDELKFPDLKNDYIPQEVKAGRVNNILYRVPFSTDIGVLFYRKDLLKKENLSGIKTFDELLRISQKIMKQRPDTNYGYLWQGDHYEGLSAMFLEVLTGFGGFWINEKNNDVGLNKPEAVRAVQFLKDAIDKGVSPDIITSFDENLAREKFQNGEAVFMRGWPSAWAALNSSTSIVRGKIGIQPMVHAEGKESGSTIGGWGFGITKTTKYKEEAIKAILFFTSTEIQRKFALNAGYLPTRESLFYDPEIVNQYSYFPELVNIIKENGVNRPQVPRYKEASLILQDCLSQVLKSKKTPQDAMNIASKDTHDLLNNRYKKIHSCDWEQK